MSGPAVRRVPRGVIWAGLALAMIVPLVLSLLSPLLAWRDPVYIVAGAAGVAAFALMLMQPLLAGGYLPSVSRMAARRLHRVVGPLVLGLVAVHVAALWITSPPDVVDALLFASPTPFSLWGVIAMWALIAAALMALWRKRFALRVWRVLHAGLAVLIVGGTVVHALRVDGTMEPVSKAVLCGLVVAATVKVLVDLWAPRRV